MVEDFILWGHELESDGLGDCLGQFEKSKDWRVKHNPHSHFSLQPWKLCFPKLLSVIYFLNPDLVWTTDKGCGI